MVAPAGFEEAWHDTREFVTRLWVENEVNELQPLHPLWHEQEVWLDNLCTYRKNLGIKPRQVGFTTIATAVRFHKAYTSPTPRKVIQVVHEDSAQIRLAHMIRVFHAQLPETLRCKLNPDNKASTGFSHNKARMNRLLAGGRSQGRSWTYNDAHYTEMAKYRRANAANAGEEEDVDAEVYASIDATMHGDDSTVTVESTGDGPHGKYYQLWKIARESRDWGYTFVGWTASDRYASPVPPGFEPTDEEQRLIREFGLTLEQVVWRREKFEVDGYSPLRFRREFPLVDTDPFLLDAEGWFVLERIEALLSLVPAGDIADKSSLKVYDLKQPGRKYFAALDTSGGVGLDEASLVILRDDLVEVARWDSNLHSPKEQAMQAHRLCGLYDALLLVEANKYGTVVLEHLREIGGVRLWSAENGKDFWSSGEGSGNSKRAAYSHARDMIDHGHFLPRNHRAIHQLANIVEKSGGQIEARFKSDHDDRADSYVLALWCARRYWSPSGSVNEAKERMRAMLRLARGGRDGAVR